MLANLMIRANSAVDGSVRRLCLDASRPKEQYGFNDVSCRLYPPDHRGVWCLIRGTSKELDWEDASN